MKSIIASSLHQPIKELSPIIAPSILSADFANLQRDVEMINNSQADWIHVDIMDGMFVPNISFGFPVTAAIKKHAKKPLDVHLMIVDPDRYLSQWKAVGANMLTVHIEACTHLHRTIQVIKALGMQAGVALNPHTPIAFLEDIIADIDLVCVMSVNPGFGGQKFIENSYAKVRALKALILAKDSSAKIEIDGGVDLVNISKLMDAGADVFVAGNTVFSSPNPTGTIAALKGTRI
jgi:ribulose-phosphate 3-epimerase